MKKEGPKYLDASRDGFVVTFPLYCCRFSCCVYTQKEPERGRGASSQTIVLEMGNLAVDGGILISCTYTIRDEDQFYVAAIAF